MYPVRNLHSAEDKWATTHTRHPTCRARDRLDASPRPTFTQPGNTLHQESFVVLLATTVAHPGPILAHPLPTIALAFLACLLPSTLSEKVIGTHPPESVLLALLDRSRAFIPAANASPLAEQSCQYGRPAARQCRLLLGLHIVAGHGKRASTRSGCPAESC